MIEYYCNILGLPPAKTLVIRLKKHKQARSIFSSIPERSFMQPGLSEVLTLSWSHIKRQNSRYVATDDAQIRLENINTSLLQSEPGQNGNQPARLWHIFCFKTEALTRRKTDILVEQSGITWPSATGLPVSRKKEQGNYKKRKKTTKSLGMRVETDFREISLLAGVQTTAECRHM